MASLKRNSWPGQPKSTHSQTNNEIIGTFYTSGIGEQTSFPRAQDMKSQLFSLLIN